MEGSLLMIILGVIFLSAVGLVQTSCDLCSPGSYRSSPCTCTPCPANTFTEKQNNNTKCQQCKKRCEPSMVVSSKCTSKKDMTCSCRKGHYLEPGILFCVLCDTCSVGYGAIQACNTNANTICAPCVTGKNYSNVSTMSKPCTQCSMCRFGYTVEKNCTNTTDTICEPIIVVNTTRKPTRTSKAPVSSTGGSSEPLGSKERDYIIPSVAVVVFVVLCVLIVIVIKLYQKAKSRRRQQQVAGHDYEDGEEVIPVITETMSPSIPLSTVRHGGLRGRHTRHLRRNDNSRESSDSQGSTGSLQEDKPRDSERRLRELPNETLIIERLALLLNPRGRNNWVRLAGELGYSKVEVDYFNMDPRNATQSLLANWETSNSSTLGTLRGHLKNMKRDDACAVLEDV